MMTMEEEYKKAKLAVLPITGNWLAALATSSLHLANALPNDRPEWDRNPKTDQTWKALKYSFNPLHKRSNVRHA